MALRDYQTRALTEIETRFSLGARRVLLVSPVGSGKTAMFVDYLRNYRTTIVIVHRKELLDQASKRLDTLGVPHGIIMSGHPRYDPKIPVQVASIQTLVRRPKPEAELVILDEAHHARAKSWEMVLGSYKDSRVLGVTATPWRIDGRGLGDVFETAVVAAEPMELVTAGWLAPVTGFGYDLPDLSDVKVSHGDYNEKQLGGVMSKPRIVGNIVEQWQQHAAGLSTVVFAVSLEHSRILQAQFQAAGASAEHVDGATPKAEREAILRRVATGQTRVLLNVGILTEGTDIPNLKCAVLARPTKSTGLYIQMVGRVRRPFNGVVARVHDHAGCLQAHLLPDSPRDYSLTTQTKRAPIEPLRTCKKCLAIYDPQADSTCPACGHENVAAPRVGPDVVADGKELSFEEIAQSDSYKQQEFEKLKAIGERRGFKPGWAFYRFKEKFGEAPGPKPMQNIDPKLLENL